MRCSDCSETVRPVVACDIDGVLGDYHRHFLRFAAIYLSGDDATTLLLHASAETYGGLEHFRDYCCRVFNIDVATFREIKLAYRQGAQKRSMPIYDGAKYLTAQLNEAAELWLTTTRPYLSLDGVIKDTTFWLDRHGISYKGLLFDDDKYATLAERVDPKRVVAILDDNWEYIDAATEVFGEDIPILVRNPFNKEVIRPCIVKLRGADIEVLGRIEMWDEVYA